MADDLLKAVTEALQAVIDPETGRDLVTMGLIYDIVVVKAVARVAMTTTTRGCPLSEMLRLGAEAAVAAVPGIARAEVRLTWDPPWTSDRVRSF